MNLWFHLRPYKDLPADFRETHASVWVDIDSNLLDAQRVHEHYHEYLDELEFAGEVGFEVNDRVLPQSYFDRFAAGIAGPVVTSSISDAGHAVELDQPVELATQINAFFADQQY